MAIKKNSKKEVETKEVETKEVKQLEITVKRARDFSDDEKISIAIELEVNGVTIYNCWYREGKKKDGTDYSMVAFPSREDPNNKGKYYNYAYVKLSEEDVENIASQIEQLI